MRSLDVFGVDQSCPVQSHDWHCLALPVPEAGGSGLAPSPVPVKHAGVVCAAGVAQATAARAGAQLNFSF